MNCTTLGCNGNGKNSIHISAHNEHGLITSEHKAFMCDKCMQILSEMFNSETQLCSNCEGENAKTGYVEQWDNKCPECGRKVEQ